MPWGPADPNDPPPFQWYGALERHDCQRLRDSLIGEGDPPLWVALTAVCAAAIEGDSSQWAVAEQAAAGGTSGQAGGEATCLENAAGALLRRALDWHRANPDRQPAVTFAASGSAVACAFEITEVDLVSEDDGVLQTGGGAQGPLTGGTLIAVIGRGIDQPTSAMVGSVTVEIDENAFVDTGPLGELDEVVALRTPPADQPGTVDVRVTNRAGQVVKTQAFTYTAPG